SHECEERLQSCQFCELELPWKELDEHCLVCGSRTELCRDCGRYVTLRDRPEHDLTCSAADNSSGPLKTNSKLSLNKTKITATCSRCMESFPAEDLELHELECVPATRLDKEEAAPQEKQSEEDFSTSALSRAYKAISLSHRPGRGPWGDGGDPDQISTCPHCHLALPLFTLRWHEVKCQIHIRLK
ncbi:XIAP-associated factor 1-like, partial [Plectropomus leopardus]|uniref:XIAP-associated factor 1-like n=1 Tax=Plectropomus leopardus TaxID=160734 RepID=UPI001C4AA144